MTQENIWKLSETKFVDFLKKYQNNLIVVTYYSDCSTDQCTQEHSIECNVSIFLIGKIIKLANTNKSNQFVCIKKKLPDIPHVELYYKNEKIGNIAVDKSENLNVIYDKIESLITMTNAYVANLNSKNNNKKEENLELYYEYMQYTNLQKEQEKQNIEKFNKLIELYKEKS